MTVWSTSASTTETATLEGPTRTGCKARHHAAFAAHRLRLATMTGVRMNTRVSSQNSSLQTGKATPVCIVLVIQGCVMHALLQTLTEPLNLK